MRPCQWWNSPEGHSLNDIWVNYGTDGILKLLKNAETEKIRDALCRYTTIIKLV